MKEGLSLNDFSCRSVRHVDLAIPPGRTTGLTGPSGSGKSLFLRAVADLEPYEGQMSLDGADASGMPAHLWRCKVGLLPAESAWWFDTVGEHFSHIMPLGFDTLGFAETALTWQISHLSSGERQRLSLLRLLVNQPRVLLLDEPTANLDSVNTRRVEAFIMQYCQSRQACTIWISHDVAQLERCCDDILVLEQQAFRSKQGAMST